MQSDSEEIFNSLKLEYEELGTPTTKAINSSKHLSEFKQRLLDAFHFISPKSAGKTPRSPIVHIIWCLLNNVRSETECSVCGTYHARFMPDHSRATTCSKHCSDVEKASKQIGAVRSEESKLKRKQTNIERTGYANPMQNPQYKLNQQKTIEDVYGVSNISQLESVKLKKIDTNQSKRNVANPSQCSILQQQRKTKTLAEYGVEYYFLTQEFKEKSKSTNRENLGVEYPMQSPTVRAKSEESCRRKFGKTNYMKQLKVRLENSTNSQIDHTIYVDDKELLQDLLSNKTVSEVSEILGIQQSYLYKVLNAHEIPLPGCQTESTGQRQVREFMQSILIDSDVRINDREVLRGLELDMFFPEHNIAIEYNGVRFHSTKFRPNPAYHLKKTVMCEEQGIRLIQIFEDEWLTKRQQVERKLMSIVNVKTTESVYARNCVIVEPDSHNVMKFLEDNHIQGAASSKFKYGLEYNGELVAVMTFNKGTSTNSQYLELNRYATSVQVVGGFGKLLSHFWKMNPDIERIVSFADRRYSSMDNIYESNGWLLVGTTRPSYTVLVGTQRRRREHFMKHKLEKMLENYDPNLTERENCENHGLYRIYDCGLLKYEMKILS